MGIFYDFDAEEEADREYEAWFATQLKKIDEFDVSSRKTVLHVGQRVFNHFRYNDDTTLLEQAKALGKACRASIVSEHEKHGLTEDDIEFNDIRVH